MKIYILQNNNQSGPHTIEEVRSKLHSGELNADSLLWHEGIPNWIRISSASEIFSNPPPPPVELIPDPHVAEGKSTGQSTPASSLGSNNQVKRPGFWLRTGAYLIDIGILLIPSIIIICIPYVGLILNTVAYWLYFALLESSEYQATLGKRACGFIVTDMNGNRISFGKATARYFGMIITSFTFGIGYIMCGWTQKKQCLHDMIAGCLMAKKN